MSLRGSTSAHRLFPPSAERHVIFDGSDLVILCPRADLRHQCENLLGLLIEGLVSSGAWAVRAGELLSMCPRCSSPPLPSNVGGPIIPSWARIAAQAALHGLGTPATFPHRHGADALVKRNVWVRAIVTAFARWSSSGPINFPAAIAGATTSPDPGTVATCNRRRPRPSLQIPAIVTPHPIRAAGIRLLSCGVSLKSTKRHTAIRERCQFGVDIIPYPKTVHERPGGHVGQPGRRPRQPLFRSGEDRRHRVHHRAVHRFDNRRRHVQYLYRWTNSTIFRVVSSIGPFPP